MKFIYTGKTKESKVQSGTLEAPNEAAAVKALQGQGLFVTNLKQEGATATISEVKIPFLSSFLNRVNLKDKIIFTQQLAMMTKSGLPLIDAFTTLEEQTENKYFAKVINEITKEVRGGKPLSSALAKYPNIFSKFYVSIVAAGEKSGKVDEVLARLAEELQKDYELVTKIKAAVTYPILVIFAMVGIVILMLIFVVPELKKIFTDMGVELPLITRIILGGSDLIIKYWYIFLILIIGLIFAARFWVKTQKGGYLWDGFKIKVPIIGKLLKNIYMTRFCRTTGTLVASGLPILSILKTTQDVLVNRLYQDALKRVAQKIETGQTFSNSLKTEKLFAPMIYHLITVGEKSGKLDDILLTTATFFDREVETTTNNLATLIEPILIIIIGAGVGLVVAAVIMPIYSLVNVI